MGISIKKNAEYRRTGIYMGRVKDTRGGRARSLRGTVTRVFFHTKRLFLLSAVLRVLP